MTTKTDSTVLFTIVNKEDNDLAVVNLFFLHPKEYIYAGGGIFGVTNVTPRTDLGMILINTRNNETQVLDSRFTLSIASHSSESFIVKYDLLSDQVTKEKKDGNTWQIE